MWQGGGGQGPHVVQAGGGTSVHAYRLRLHTSPDGSEHAYVYVSKRGEERREGGGRRRVHVRERVRFVRPDARDRGAHAVQGEQKVGSMVQGDQGPHVVRGGSRRQGPGASRGAGGAGALMLHLSGMSARTALQPVRCASLYVNESPGQSRRT